jgi:hypothetical protein
VIDQGQSSARELKNENHFLKDYIHRLNVASSEYQTLHPPDSLKKEINVCQDFFSKAFSIESKILNWKTLCR